MDHYRTFIYIFVALYLLPFQSSRPQSNVEPDSARATSGVEFLPSLRSIQADGTIFLFTGAYAASIDVDELQFKPMRRSTLGFRLGIERFETGGPGGATHGSPHLDYNLLFRHSLASESWRVDVFFGCVRHSSEFLDPPEWLVKYGGEFRWKAAPGVFGLLFKANRTKAAGTIGIGFYVGWDR